MAALRYNLQQVSRLTPASHIMAVIKSDGYGHGMLRVASALSKADAFAVTSSDEAIKLRKSGIIHPIILLGDGAGKSELSIISKELLQPTVFSFEHIRALEQTCLPRPVDVWLKIDTGMHRLGFHPQEVSEVYARLVRCDNVSTVNFMTHLANADDRENPMTDLQIDLFDTSVAGFAGQLSIANSGAIIGWPRSHRNWVRPGIMLYGASPFLEKTGEENGLRSVMTLTSEIMAVKMIRKGEAVGYGSTWVCSEEMPVAVIAIGYGDGYPRHAQMGTPVLVNGVRVPLVGRVSMDMITVDLRKCPRAVPGDPVVLWGTGLPVEEVARKAETISYELLCGVTQRVSFEEVDEK